MGLGWEESRKGHLSCMGEPGGQGTPVMQTSMESAPTPTGVYGLHASVSNRGYVTEASGLQDASGRPPGTENMRPTGFLPALQKAFRLSALKAHIGVRSAANSLRRSGL